MAVATGAALAALMVRLNVVATDKLPGSVAVTVTEKGEPVVVVGVPLITLPDRLRPAGKPVTLNVSASPSGSEKEGATFRLNIWLTVAVWLAMPVVVGAWLTGTGAVTVTLTVPEIVWLAGMVASLTNTVKVCTPTGKADTFAVLLAGGWVIVPGPLKT